MTRAVAGPCYATRARPLSLTWLLTSVLALHEAPGFTATSRGHLAAAILCTSVPTPGPDGQGGDAGASRCPRGQQQRGQKARPGQACGQPPLCAGSLAPVLAWERRGCSQLTLGSSAGLQRALAHRRREWAAGKAGVSTRSPRHPVSMPAASQTERSSSHHFWLISGEPPPPAGGAGCVREGGATGGSPPPTCTCSAPLDRVWVEDGWASRPRRRPWGALRTWRLAEAAGPGSVIV